MRLYLTERLFSLQMSELTPAARSYKTIFGYHSEFISSLARMRAVGLLKVKLAYDLTSADRWSARVEKQLHDCIKISSWQVSKIAVQTLAVACNVRLLQEKKLQVPEHGLLLILAHRKRKLVLKHMQGCA